MGSKVYWDESDPPGIQWGELEFPQIFQAGHSQCKLTAQTPQYKSVPSPSSTTQSPQGFTFTHPYRWHSLGFPCCLAYRTSPFLPSLKIRSKKHLWFLYLIAVPKFHSCSYRSSTGLLLSTTHIPRPCRRQFSIRMNTWPSDSPGFGSAY